MKINKQDVDAYIDARSLSDRRYRSMTSNMEPKRNVLIHSTADFRNIAEAVGTSISGNSVELYFDYRGYRFYTGKVK